MANILFPQTLFSLSTSSMTIENEIHFHGFEFCKDSTELTWAENHAAHPRNWSLWIKIYNTSVVILLEVFTTMISASGAATARQSQHEYGVGKVYSIFAHTSIYLFGQGIGSIFFPPISESFGRKPLYIYCMFLTSICCLIVGLVPYISAVIIGRFFEGLLSAIPTVVVIGSIEDMYGVELRIWIVFAWGVLANIGLLLGPIYSVYIAEYLGWRWVYIIAAIINLFLTILTLFLRESRPTQILLHRLKSLNKATTSKTPFTIYNPDHTPSLHSFITESLTRPTILVFTEPIVFLITLISAVDFAQVYLLTEAIPFIYTQPPFSFTQKEASLAFLPITIGLLLDILPRFYDHFFIKRIRERGGVVRPEDKIRGFVVGAPLLAVGLWCLAFTIPPLVNVPWFISFLPLILIGFATNEFDCSLAGYLADSYTIFSASAFASLSFVRAILSGILPLVTNQMYRGMGANWATALLAGVATMFCAVPVLFLKYGERLRERSRFAKFSREAEKRMCNFEKSDEEDGEIEELSLGEGVLTSDALQDSPGGREDKVKD